MQRRLLAEPSLDLKKACDLAQGMEAANRNAKEIQAKGSESLVHSIKGRSQKAQLPEEMSNDPSSFTREQSPGDIVHVNSVSQSVPESFKVPVEINGTPVTMELDTGAAVSLVSEATWSEQLHRPKLEPCTLKLQSYPDRNLEVLGSCSVQVQVNGDTAETLPLVVVGGRGLSLLGRNWLKLVKLDWTKLAKINGVTSQTNRPIQKQLENLLQENQELFKDELGHCQGIKAKLQIKENSSPKFHRPRPIALALKEKVEADLDRQEKLGVLEKIETAQWAAPIVPVPKPNGAIRLCGDYKVSVNPYLEVNQYPLPRPEELFAALNGGEKFTKLDLSEAYLQIELEDESKQYLVINTHRGLYRFNRLPYGVASAPAIFQQIMEQILPKIPGVVCYIDDILVTGRSDNEHLEHLEAVFQSLRQYGFRIKRTKCWFFQDSVEYLGSVVSKEGIQTSKRKIEAILKVKTPTNQTELKSFLGMVNPITPTRMRRNQSRSHETRIEKNGDFVSC